MTTLIETRVDEAAGWILLNNTRHKNAINYEMYDAMFEALDRFEKDERVRAVVVSGNGGNFSAGFDVTQGSPEPYRDFVRNVSSRLSKRLWYFPKPTIAAVEGYCIGGGFELAMGADLVYSAEDAVMGEPEIDFFYIPDFNSIPCISLPRKAKEKMTYNNNSGTVIYRSKMTHGKNKKNFSAYTAEEFIAAITQHIPEKSFQMIR